jgi:hypothetical protein
MALGKHQRNKDGEFRKERGDSLAKNLRQTYPEFENVRGDTRLDTLRKRFDAESIDDVRRALRNQGSKGK